MGGPTAQEVFGGVVSKAEGGGKRWHAVVRDMEQTASLEASFFAGKGGAYQGPLLYSIFVIADHHREVHHLQRVDIHQSYC